MLRAFAALCLAAIMMMGEARAQMSAMPDFAPSLGNVYIGGGFGYGGVASRTVSLTDGFACPGPWQGAASPVLSGGRNGCEANAQGHGFTVHALAGYTMPGWIGVSGLELRGRLGQEPIEAGLGGSVALSNGWSNTALGTYRTSINGGLALSARLGANIGGVLPFFRGGLGIVHLTESLNFDATGARACAACLPGGGKIDWSRSQWAPSFVMGLGLEVPVAGNVFLRAEGEMESIFRPGTRVTIPAKQAGGQLVGGQAILQQESWLHARRIMLSVGMRF